VEQPRGCIPPEEITHPGTHRRPNCNWKNYIGGFILGAQVRVVDAQIHPPHATVPGGDPSRPPADGLDDHIVSLTIARSLAAMDAVGVDAALVHPAGPVELARPYVERHSDRFRIVARPDPQDSAIVDIVADAATDSTQVGLRALLAWPPKGVGISRVREGIYDTMLAAMQRSAVPLFVFVFEELTVVEQLATDYPELPIVVDHFGLTQRPLYQLAADPWSELPHLLRLAQFPNVLLKMTGLPALSTVSFPYSDLWPNIHRVLESFGIDRVMWGSDYTRCAPDHTYAAAVEWLRRTTELSESEKSDLMGGNLARIFDWQPATLGTHR
jgi:L-fuconolactonase